MGKRYVADFNTGKPDDFIRFVSEDFLRKEGFAPAVVKGEMVWKKGKGLLTAPQFLKLQYAGGMVHLEAWIKYALLPGVYLGEMGLDGGFACVPKTALRNKVNALIALLYQPVNIPPQPSQAEASQPAAVPAGVSQPVPAGEGGPAACGTGIPPAPAAFSSSAPMSEAAPTAAPAYPGTVSDYPPSAGFAPQPIPVAVHNPTGKATLSLVMGLCSILGCFIPIIGVVTGIIGIPSGITGRRTTARGMATFGLVLSIVFLIVSILNWIAGILLFFMI